MRALITGISGFVGQALTEQLLLNEWEVCGFDHRESSNFPCLHTANILDQTALANAIRKSRPDVIFHLAGVIKSNVSKDYYNTNILGTLSLFEALVETGHPARVIIASSSAVYGPGTRKRPITEKFALRPATDYAISKVAQEMVARRFSMAYNFPVIIVRTFNLLGSGQSPELACSAFAQQIALNEILENPSPIKTGNLSAQRDFVNVHDAVHAYELLAQKGKPGATYNVCSGQAVSIQACLNTLLEMAQKKLAVEIDSSKMQNNDVSNQIGSARLIEKAVGWQPRITLQQSLFELLNDWRIRIKSTAE